MAPSAQVRKTSLRLQKHERATKAARSRFIRSSHEVSGGLTELQRQLQRLLLQPVLRQLLLLLRLLLQPELLQLLLLLLLPVLLQQLLLLLLLPVLLRQRVLPELLPTWSKLR